MFRRPLIPIVLSLAGGIFLGHEAFSSVHALLPAVSLALAASLTGTILMPSKFRFHSLLFVFFVAGILLDMRVHDISPMIPLADQRRVVTIEGTLLEPIKIANQIARLKVKVNRIFINQESLALDDVILVNVYDHLVFTLPGDKILFPAKLRPFKNFNNPGCYDYESAMKRRGVSCAASISDGRRIVQMGRGDLPFPQGVLEELRRPLRIFFRDKLPYRDQALFRALILGERQEIDRKLREPFNRTGLGHVLAVSGLHIGLVAWLAFQLFRSLLSLSYELSLRVDTRKIAAVLTVIPVVAYTSLTGFQLSSQRAMIMVLAYLFSLILHREKETWSTLGLAALIILALDPHALFSISFQLSFIAVIGILWFVPLILNMILSFHGRDESGRSTSNRFLFYVLGLLAVSLSATIFLLPINAFYFHRVSIISVLANLTTIPILGLWIIPAGLFCSAALLFSKMLASIFLQLGQWGLEGMMRIIFFWSRLPFSHLWTVTPNPFEIFLYYSLITFLFFGKHFRWAKVGAVLVAFLVFVDVGYWIYQVRLHSDLRVTYLDVGQGNSALLEFPGGKKMLIDGGGFSRDYFDTGEMVVAPFLWHSKILTIDYLVLSHQQSDHMNGLRFIAKAFHPKEFWSNGDRVARTSFQQLMAIVESNKIKMLTPEELTTTREIGGVKIQVLHPPENSNSFGLLENKANLNNRSLVLKVSYAGISLLFPGDIERPSEQILVLREGRYLKSDLLLSPHHGSKTSNSREFLELVRPKICIISCGERNYAGFPHPVVLKRLKAIGCKILRIDQTGAVQCTVHNGRIGIRTFLQGRSPPIKIAGFKH